MVEKFPTIVYGGIKQEVVDAVPGKMSLRTRFAIAIVKKLRGYLEHQLAEDALKNDKGKEKLFAMKTSRGCYRSLVARFQ